MRKEIAAIVEKLTIEKNISVLYACESGSRAWGFASPNSDYDVRFIYLHPLTSYLSLDAEKDTIELPINEVLDVSGWDLRKMLKLMRKSNPVIFEWLQSPIVYQEKEGCKDALFLLAKECFSAKATFHHYLGCTRNSIQNGLQEKRVRVKSYFYALRPLLAAMWIAEYSEIPPMEFSILLKIVESKVDLVDEITRLLEIKKQLLEKDTIEPIPLIQNFIIDEFRRCEQITHKLASHKCQTSLLDCFFRKMLSIQGPT